MASEHQPDTLGDATTVDTELENTPADGAASAAVSEERAPLRFNRRLRIDRIGSATTPARIGNIVEVSPDCVAEEGSVIAVRALGERKTYGELELPSGRLAKVVHGNLIAGVLGARMALQGYMGTVPQRVEVGDRLALLNIGGVIGVCDHHNKHLGAPIPVEVLGTVVQNNQPVNIRHHAIPECDMLLPDGPPLLFVLGTCMNAGKTYAACEIIRLLSHAGLKITAGKLAGVAALRDTLGMADNGATETASFLDFGLPSTVLTNDLAPMARAVIAKLERTQPDLIVLEVGDGVIGGYNTMSILADLSIRARERVIRVLCANDLVGTWGGVEYLAARNHRPDVVSGPVTDNNVGTSYIATELGIPCANARNEPVELARHIARLLGREDLALGA